MQLKAQLKAKKKNKILRFSISKKVEWDRFIPITSLKFQNRIKPK